MALKVAYAGFDLLKGCLDGLLAQGCEMVRFFTCRVDEETEHSSYIRRVAQELHVPLTDRPLTADDLCELDRLGCDLLISAAYYHRIPVLPDLKVKMVNVHPSLLPEGRGAWPMPVMILRQMRQGGITIHRTVQAMDAGEILLQRAFPLDEQTDLERMTEQINHLLPEMVSVLVPHFEELYQNAVAQSEGSYWPCPTEKDWTLTPETPFEEAERILRAFYGFECIYQDRGQSWRLMRCRAVRGEGQLPVCGGHIEGEYSAISDQ